MKSVSRNATTVVPMLHIEVNMIKKKCFRGREVGFMINSQLKGEKERRKILTGRTDLYTQTCQLHVYFIERPPSG
jgi:hypothetical protein